MADYNGQYTGQQIDEAVGKVGELSQKVDVNKKTSITDGLVDNTDYQLGEVSALDITSIPADTSKGIIIYFSTPSSGCTLVYAANTNWLGSDAPSVEGGKSYVLTILDGVCGLNEYNPQTMTT